ncbi:MAG: amino acid adenylation domain-containing protein [Chloroflexota bacterium]|nr:amino acid adenylation domain-containing protein [Chloroflexota bacterium]
MDLEHFVEQSVAACFEAQVRRAPDRLAIQTDREGLSFDQLNRAANRLARAIVQRRGHESEPVAVLLERGNGVAVAILAVLKAGKFYVALDPTDPAARLRALVADSQAQLVVSKDAHEPLARQLGIDLLNLDRVAALADDDLNLPVSPDAPLNIMYTSGSTGQPKGVLQNQRNLLQTVWARTQRLKLTADERVVFLLSPSFGVSAAELFGTLLIGGAIFPFDIREHGFPRLADWIDEQRISVYHSVPTVLRGLLNALAVDRVLESVRIVKLGGEPVFRQDVQRFFRHFRPSTAFHTALGTTETYIAATYELDRATALDLPMLPAGYPELGREIMLVDEALQPVPPGQVGEILIKSRYLAPGYWRRPDLTASVFLPDPAGGPERLYRSGDLGRLLPNGALLHLGRKDFQVKVNGHLVATSEIELALRELAGVREAAVVARDGAGGEKRLVAYVALSAEASPTTTDLRVALATRLPTYMRPATFVVLDHLPRLATGKLDLQALPAIENGQRPPMSGPLVGARSRLEQQLVEIWEDVLGVRPVGVHDRFVELGGDSLRAVALFAEIERRLGRRTRTSSLLSASTVAELGQLLEQQQDGRDAALVPIQPLGSKPPLFCVHDLSGGVLGYAALARHLGPDQPVYGLEAPRPEDRMEAIAGRYLSAIRAVQPTGPYRLGGYCFGGFVAFEMARQLEAQGERVALLAIMEGFAPLGRRGRRWRDGLAALVPTLRNLPVWCSVYGPGVIRGGPREIGRRTRLRLLRARRRLAPQEIVSSFGEFSSASREILSMNIAAVRGYAAPPYSGSVTLFRSRALPLDRARDPSMGWGAVALGGVETHEFPVPHQALLAEPQVRLVARVLADCLDRAG